jgi:dUTP pyrophosphatase
MTVINYIGTQPTRAYSDDAGLDLTVQGDWTIPPHQFVDVDLGCSVKAPEGYWTLLIGRSSTLRKRGLLVATGVIDTGYTGELYAGCFNLTNEPVHIKHGERLAQLILFKNQTEQATLQQVPYHGATERGNRGFGSSGK